MSRLLVWFSAGAASAVAAALALKQADGRDVVIAYTNPGSEHVDNARFLEDCERWLGQPVVRLDVLDPSAGRYQDEPDMDCSLLCATIAGEL